LDLGGLLSRYTGISLLAVTNDFGSTYAVPLFFLLSGYCIHLSNIKYIKDGKPLPLKNYYKRRFLRIYPAYLVALSLSLLVNLMTGDLPQVNTQDLLTHIFLFQGFSVHYFNSINVVLWTITIEVAFYVIYPIFYYLRLNCSLPKALSFTLIVSTISILFFSLKNNISYPQKYFVLNLWFAWCCGAYLADRRTLNKLRLNSLAHKLLYTAVVILFIWTKIYNSQLFIIINYQLSILLWSAPLAILLDMEGWLNRRRSRVLNILVAIGLSSYSLYLLHEPIIYLKNFLAHSLLPEKFQIAAEVVGIFCIPIVAWFSYIYVEKPFISKQLKRNLNG
jgi:peptidoglycan/LPS O-acetylase OafA/YrhL